MFTLTFKGPDGSEQTAQLDAELSVGREEGNDLVIPDSAISRKHCRFFVEGNEVLVEDLGSSNGVTVDGNKIDGPTAVSTSSEISLGEWVVQLSSGRPSRVSPKRPGMDGPTGERPARGNGSAPRPTRQLASRSSSSGAIERGTRRVPAQGGPKKDALARPPTGAVPRFGSIKGLVGPWAGRSFNLTKPVMVIGRSAPADIVVDDDSVSRRHCEIRKSGGGYVVRDLGSANGISVNGEPTSEADLVNGDEVLLGAVTFTYSGPGAAKRGMPAGKKRLLVIGLVGVVVVLGIVGVAVSSGNPPSQPPPAGGGMQVAGGQDQDEKSGAMSLCKLYTDVESNDLDWQHGLDNCNKVLRLDPLNVEASQLAKKAKREIEMEKSLNEGKRLAEVGRDEEAVEKYLVIDPTSYYFRRAKTAFDDARSHISRKAQDECKTWSLNGRDWCKAQEFCAKWLDYNCLTDNKDFDLYKKNFDNANKVCDRRMDWKCTDKFKKFMTEAPGGPSGTEIMKGLLQAKYHHPKLVEELLDYATKGDARKVANDLDRFKHTEEGRKMEKEITAIMEDLQVADGRYTSGAPLIPLDPDKALAKFKDAYDSDARLMPPGHMSDLVRRMKRDLAAGYLKQAQKRMDQQRIFEAAPFALKAYEQNPGDPDVVDVVTKVEAGADEYINKGCPGLAKAKQMIRPSQTAKLSEINARWQKLKCQD